MTKARKARKSKPAEITYEQAVRLLPEALAEEAAANAAYRHALAEFHATQDRLVSEMVALLQDAGRRLAQKGIEVVDRDAETKRLRKIVDIGEPEEIGRKKVDDPAVSDAQFLHEQANHPDSLDVGKVVRDVNWRTIIGGFATFKSRSRVHEAAAMRFLNLHERAELSTARATDYTQPLVDTSPGGIDMLARADGARQELEAVRTAIGANAFLLLRRVIVEQISVRAIACPLGAAAPTGHQIKAVSDRVRDALDRLADHWELSGVSRDRAATIRAQDDGSPMVFTGTVVNPKRSR